MHRLPLNSKIRVGYLQAMTENRLQFSPTLGSVEFQGCCQRIREGVVFVKRLGNPRRATGVTFRHLGKLNPISRREIEDLICCWQTLLTTLDVSSTSNSQHTLPHRTARTEAVRSTGILDSADVVVIGLAESGIIPSFAMAEACSRLGLSVDWHCSSRFCCSPVSFIESHSHAPVHFLPEQLQANKYREIWVIEDEITTGQTLLNFASAIRRVVQFETLRIFALLDSSSSQPQDAKSKFRDELREAGQKFTYTTLLDASAFQFRRRRQHAIDVLAREDFGSFSNCCCPTVVIGESILNVLPKIMSDPNLYVQHGTLSPWMIDGNGVHNRIRIDASYYLYNWLDFPASPMLEANNICA